MSEQKTEERVTAADLKRQIIEAKEVMKESGMPITGQLANEINASASTTNVPEPKVEVKPEPAKAAEKVESLTSEELGALEWAKKKGVAWTTDPKVLLALHKSDQDFHKWRAENKSKDGYPTLQPEIRPPAYNPPPAYVAPPIQNRQMLENLARDYNMPAEDVERLLKFNKDFYEAASRADRERQAIEFETIRKEQQKQSVLRELSSDSVLKNPAVVAEFQRLVQERQSIDPNSFERDPNEYLNARDKALNTIARRNLEGQSLQEGIPPLARLVTPSSPPRQLAQGSGGGSLEDERGIDPKQFAKLSLEEKAAVLSKMGLKPAY